MMRRRKIEDGFTIVELLAAIAAAAVLAITTGLMLYYGYQCWMRTSEAVGIQRDGSIAMQMFENRIRRAGAGDVWEPGGNTDILRIATAGATNQFAASGGNLVYTPDVASPGDTMVVVDGGVSDFSVDVLSAGVRVQLELQGGGTEIAFDTITGYRN